MLLVISLGLGLSAAKAAPLDVYVAVDGKDNWSGGLASPSPDGKDGPVATLEAALAVARQARQGSAAAVDGIRIRVRGGTYFLARPVRIGPADSGAGATAPLTIEAYNGEKPIISGGRRITGWRKVEGKPGLWQAEIPEVRSGQWYFRQLFVNGERKQRARTPNQGFYRIAGASPSGERARFAFKEGDIKKAWVEAGDVEVVALLAWADLRMPIRAVDEAARVVTLSGAPQPSNKEDNARYYIENAAEAFDMPGEWYLDRKTGAVSYWAERGETMDSADAIASALTELVRMEGNFDAGKPVHHVTLRGLTFCHADWSLERDGYADTQAAVAIRGDLFAAGVVDCGIEDCAFAHLGGYAIELGKGCQRDRVVGNTMFDLGGGGVRIGETQASQAPFEQNHGHTITDNEIHHGGLVYPAAGGIFILQSGDNRVAYNHIHHLYYTAVSAGWTWGYQESPCHGNVIEFNHLHDLGQDRLADMGAVYTLGIQPGTVVRNNLIHDVNAWNYGGWGLYTDEGSTGIILENNVVYRCNHAGFHQHYGRENIFRNNVFAFNRENQLMRSREEGHTSFLFTNNIVYFNSGNLLGGNWGNDHYVMDRNLYFDCRSSADGRALNFSGANLEQWRGRGHDLNSQVADPLFVDPVHDNFQLRQDSPALALGFKPINIALVGVRPAGARK